MKSQRFYMRSLITFLMATGFVVATVTGIVLYFTPKGSIANWTGWALGGLGKETWGDIHIVTGIMFIVAGLVHLYFNWKPLKNYIYSKASKGLNRRSEMLTALALTGFIVVGSIQGWPPVSYILEFNEWAKTDLWAAEGAYKGGQGRSAPVDSSQDQHNQALERAQEGIDAALAEAVAKVDGSSPVASQPEAVSSEHEEHAGGTGGGGFGRMTLADVAGRYGLDYQQVTARLATEGIPYSEGETLRDIAVRAGMTPGDLGELVKGTK
jgi:uncharacterized protein DUF4405